MVVQISTVVLIVSVHATAITAGQGKLTKVKEIAVIENGPSGQRLAIADLNSKRLRYPQPQGKNPASITWSPDGRFLIHASENILYSYNDRKGGETLFVEVQRRHVFPPLFSPDSRKFALVFLDSVLVIAVPEEAGSVRGQYERLSLPQRCSTGSVQWASASVLRMISKCMVSGKDGMYLLETDGIGFRIKHPIYAKSAGFLGTDTQSGRPVVGIPLEWGETAGLVNADGTIDTLRKPEFQESEYLLAYLEARRQWVFALGGEDPGDSARIYLAGPGKVAARRWLRSFPRIRDIIFTSDGKRAYFCNPLHDSTGALGGSIFEASVQSQKTVKVLATMGDSVSFSQPLPRPR